VAPGAAAAIVALTSAAITGHEPIAVRARDRANSRT
jgi:hypothetical protein